MNAKILAIFISSFILVYIIDLIRRRKMTFKFSILWLLVGIISLLFSIQTKWLNALTQFFGFALPSNFIFFLVIAFFILLSMSSSVHINEQNSRLESMAQALALAELKIKKLEQNKEKS